MAYYKCASIYGTNNSAASVQTASGTIANFNTKLAMPIKSLEIDVNATQEEGTPTPQSPKAISGVSAVKVTACGKNLIDYNAVTDVIYNAQLQTRKGIAIKKQAGTFTVNSNYSGTCTVYSKIHYANDTWGSANTIQNGTTITAKTSTLSDGDELIIFDADTKHTTAQTIEIFKHLICEMSASATPFEQYNGTTSLINLGGTYYGGYVSQDKNGKRELVVTHGFDSFDLSQIPPTATSEGFDRWAITLSGISTRGGLPTDKKCNMTNIYLYSTTSTEHFYIAGADVRFYFEENTVRNKTIEFLYPLAEPFTIELPDGEPLNALIGTNNIFADSGDSECAYKG